MLGSTFSNFLRSFSKSAEASAKPLAVNFLGGFFSSLQFALASSQLCVPVPVPATPQSALRSHLEETLKVVLIRIQVKTPGLADLCSLRTAMRSWRWHNSWYYNGAEKFIWDHHHLWSPRWPKLRYMPHDCILTNFNTVLEEKPWTFISFGW